MFNSTPGRLPGRDQGLRYGADDGNRTHILSLGRSHRLPSLRAARVDYAVLRGSGAPLWRLFVHVVVHAVTPTRQTWTVCLEMGRAPTLVITKPGTGRHAEIEVLLTRSGRPWPSPSPT